MNFSTSIAVMLGGGIGTLIRYLLDRATGTMTQDFLFQNFPWGTILINVLGCFIIGIFSTLTMKNGKFPASYTMRTFIMTGFCGGFTTFSSFALQTNELWQADFIPASLNVLLSLFLCFIAVAAGYYLGIGLNKAGNETEPELFED